MVPGVMFCPIILPMPPEMKVTVTRTIVVEDNIQ